jgi:tRNA pseudouridine55 synthase
VLGIVLIDKPAGMTSHDVVDRMRRKFGTRRVGHAGTLDPMATGLLVVAVGAATRFLQYLPLEPKTYEGEVTFGRSSTTYDTEGELSEPAEIPEDLEARLEAAVPKFLGLVEQLPPIYSAVKVAGKPLYAYARKGQEARREPRTVHIASIETKRISTSVVRINVTCSGGTYVRALADDLGREIGCGAYLSALRRTAAGEFRIEAAHSLEEAGQEHLIALAEALPPMPLVHLNMAETSAIRQGQRVGIRRPPSERLVGLLDPEGAVIGIARVEGMELQPECVLPLEAVHG